MRHIVEYPLPELVSDIENELSSARDRFDYIDTMEELRQVRRRIQMLGRKLVRLEAELKRVGLE